MTDKTTDFLQEQLITARRAQILDAATILFAAKGFARTTIKEIAREAGLAEGTIYLYFRNKDALLTALMERLHESERRAITLAEVDTARLDDFLRNLLEQRLSHLQDDKPLFQALLAEMLISPGLGQHYYQETLAPSYALATALFKHLIERGEIRALDPELTARAIPALTLGLLMLEMLGDSELANRRAELPAFITTLLFEGLHPETTDDHD